MPKALTPEFRDGDGIKVESILANRCVKCHKKGGDATAEKYPLDTYEDLKVYMTVPAAGKGEWVNFTDPIKLSDLTRSTHAHLLSFAMLFSLTGLIFAFTSYPTWVRVIGGPWVVIAVFADVSLWWLARLSDQWGPYFAMGVIATGAASGMGLAMQITLSLWNMYGPKGKTCGCSAVPTRWDRRRVGIREHAHPGSGNKES